MNNRANYKKGSRREIIKGLYASGCVPYKSLRLMEGQLRLVQRKAKQMKEEGLIDIRKTKHGKNIYLKEHVKENEYQEYFSECYYEHYEEIKEHVRKAGYSDSRMERLMKTAEINLLMHLSQIPTYPDELAKEWIRGSRLKSDSLLYLDSRRLKAGTNYSPTIRIDDEVKKVSGSRVIGMLISPGGNYAVYHLTNHLIEWDKAGEVKMAAYLETFLRNHWNLEDEYYENTKENKQKENPLQCILFAWSMELFAKVLINENKKYRKKRPLINIDYAYRNMYVLPSDKNGIKMIQIMIVPGWKERMRKLLLAGFSKEDKDYTVIHDAYDYEMDGYVLLFCDCDIAKLKLFLKRAINKHENEVFSIYCFTFQLPLLAQFDLSGIQIKAMELEEYISLEGA